MNIEYINQTNKFFTDVISLGKKNSATLGFMPDGGFEDHARKNCIIIAHNESELGGYLMFREVPRHARISIVHLCIHNKFRKQKITTQLLDSLRNKYTNKYSGIALSCRSDYSYATKVWQNYGFCSLNKVRSRSIGEHYLNKWWYDFNKADLFSVSARESTKIKALLDVNIIVKLRDFNSEYSPSEDPRGLLADWLEDETTFYFAPETYNEIDRDKNMTRANKTRIFLNNFTPVKYDIEQQKQVTVELKKILNGNSDNDNSDRKQLATCIVSDISYFITLDNGIIDKKENIEENYNIQIYTPQEFTIKIDQLLNKEEYSPNLLSGVVFHTVSKISNNELKGCLEKFTANKKGETKTTFKNLVSDAIKKRQIIKVIKKDGDNLAFFAYNYFETELFITFIRLLEKGNKTLFMQIISEFISKSIDRKISKIIFNESYIADYQKAILNKMGFEQQDKSCWIKYVCNKVIRKLDLNNLLNELGLINSNLKIDSVDDNHLLDIERKLFPLKISDASIPCYIIPIKAVWARELFDYKIAKSYLFGADADKIWNIENVYYRHTKPITEIAPARILWYISHDNKVDRSMAIVATSYLEEVVTDKPKVLFRANKHYGIYEWNDIYKLCDNDVNKNIRMLRFSGTEVFDFPIVYKNIQQVLMKNGRKTNTFTSPLEVNNEIFEQLYILGKWKK